MTVKRDLFWPLLIVGTLFLISGQSEVATPDFSFNIDKIAHFAVFGALATSMIRMDFFRKQGWKGALQVCLMVSLFGGLDEWRQSFTPGRLMEFDDWLADSLGAMVAVMLYQGWPRYRKRLETKVC